MYSKCYWIETLAGCITIRQRRFKDKYIFISENTYFEKKKLKRNV